MRRAALVVAALAVALTAAGTALAVSGDSPDTAIRLALGRTETTSTQKYKITGTNVCADVSHVAWFRWDATETATITADTFGSNYDTVVAIYDDNLSELACNDDFTFSEPCGGRAKSTPDLCSLVSWSATQGQTYYIAVGSFSDTRGGKLDLTLSD